MKVPPLISRNRSLLGRLWRVRHQALLVGARSLDVHRQIKKLPGAFSNTGPEPLNFAVRYNKALYGLEVALTGELNTFQLEGSLPPFAARLYAESAQRTFQEIIDRHKRHRSGIPYHPVVKIAPYGRTEMKGDILAALEMFANRANTNFTSLFYYMGHGSPDSLEVGLDESLSHEELLAALDLIPGRKVLLLSACYSGAVIEIVRQKPNQQDYVVLTSTTANQVGVNWNDDVFNQRLMALFSSDRSISTFDNSPILEWGDDPQVPQVFFGFDDVV